MILNPPFTTFNFSLNRSIDLYLGNTSEMDFSNYLDDYLIGKLNNTLNTSDVYVVGEYNKYYPFYLIKDSKDKNIYTLDPNYNINKLAPIANSLESLYRVCNQIKLFIESEGAENPIQKELASVEKMQMIIADFKKYSPGCYYRFWMERPMGELIIGLEI